MFSKAAVFYDGNFFFCTSYHYKYYHNIGKFLDLTGLHRYIENKIEEAADCRCRIVEAHLFRGRYSLDMAKSNKTLETDRLQDQLLIEAGIESHFNKINDRKDPPEEKGIDVWLSLEAYERTINNQFDYVVLYVADQDYLPLVKKLASLGVSVVIVAVDVKQEWGHQRVIKTSSLLLREQVKVIMLSDDIERSGTGAERVFGVSSNDMELI